MRPFAPVGVSGAGRREALAREVRWGSGELRGTKHGQECFRVITSNGRDGIGGGVDQARMEVKTIWPHRLPDDRE